MSVNRILAPALMGLFVVFSSASFGQSEEESEEESKEKPIRLAEVPTAARDAAQKTLGTAPTEARVISGTTPQEYELTAKDKSGKEKSVHVRADGKVVKEEKDEHEDRDYE
ncbi:hypothetical protein [Steroidobacter cummioxidans]|uniref:hypothetical protein n=1 Tax=Steroidobacter cummioxidans TaxID=1803913 RepID=UPI0012908AC0|nr:hypothetical protein [Steroidobacter cummioxidans]